MLVGDSLHARLEEIARDVFGDDGIVLADATVADDIPEWDSLAHVNLMYSIEEEFSIEFNEDEFTGFSSIGELKNQLRRKGVS
jgi:acyl carrier protein